MTDQFADQPGQGGGEETDPARPRFTDKRRIDPETGAVRESQPTPAAPEPEAATPPAEPDAPAPAPGGAEALAAERLEDLQRLQAEYVNYRRRVDRDRLVARDQTVVAMVEALLGVLDDVELARQHGELAEGPFASIADKLEASLAKFGWERYGAAGEPFDPTVHEALMHSHSDEVSEPTVVQVLQPGHRVGDRIVRAARVAVAEPGA
ncbi:MULTISPECIES: nucleotide exchange factor GrpE [unclassified Actinotalea]|uniref:nucleotide exchange factor GrpE n=1 Tax=unclassified Actinotalea TaxID=2638618 RepID=UPI0015F73108|nr:MULTISPECIES: nucleotide exchange factor GrpE [unclassified Actinotalea]